MQALLTHLAGPITVILPIALLSLKFVLKIAVDQRISKVVIARSFISAPVDIVFLALSFFSAFIISPMATNAPLSYGQFVYVFVIMIIVSIATIIFSRRSDNFLDDARLGWCVVATAAAYIVSVPALTFSIIVLAG